MDNCKEIVKRLAVWSAKSTGNETDNIALRNELAEITRNARRVANGTKAHITCDECGEDLRVEDRIDRRGGEYHKKCYEKMLQEESEGEMG